MFWVDNRSCLIYQYSNMAPRLLGKKLLVFKFSFSFVSQFPKESWIPRKRQQIKKFVLKTSEPC